MIELDDLKQAFCDYPEVVRVDAAHVEQVRAEYPNLPEEYFAFMAAIGLGGLGALNLYSGPIPAAELRPQASGLDHVLAIGDDGQGYCLGFDTQNGHRLVEVDPDGEIDLLEESLLDRVRKSLG